MSRHRLVLALVAAALLSVACGRSVQRPSVAPSTTASESTSASRAGLVVTGNYGDLPLPPDAASLEARFDGMPDEVLGTPREDDRSGRAWYAGPSGEFGIEATDVADTYIGDPTPQQAFDRMRSQFTGKVVVCAAPPAHCLTGRSDDQLLVVWGHDDSPFALAALAPDERHLTALLEAWRGA